MLNKKNKLFKEVYDLVLGWFLEYKSVHRCKMYTYDEMLHIKEDAERMCNISHVTVCCVLIIFTAALDILSKALEW